VLRVHSGCFSTSSASLDKEKTVSLAELPSASFTKGTHRLMGPIFHAADYLPITTIWKECGIIGARGPRIHAGAPAGGGVAPAAGAAGTGPYSAVIVKI
jgi:hypothetical protein